MKRLWLAYSTLALLAVFTGCIRLNGETVAPAATNRLTEADLAGGWQLLFDGKSTLGWHSFRRESFPDRGWRVEEGCLKKVKGERGGDIVSEGVFSEFDLEWEWKLPARSNNGLKYFVSNKRGSVVGHEYQMIDDAVVGRNAKGSTGSFYNVLAPRSDKPLKPPGEWNHSRVLVQGNHVEHWLNGEKILEYELGSSEVLAAVAASKFRDVEGFGTRIEGHILLTDHGDEAWYRNIKIRDLARHAATE